jgi:hypothetical protein
MAPPDNEQAVSLAEKPEPDTVTVAPAGAETGLSVIDGGGALMVTMAEAESPREPVAVIVYPPAGTLATTNDAVKVPPEIEQV